MVVEHTFVTTMEWPEAQQSAIRFLNERGFTAMSPAAFPVPGSQMPQMLEMRRGRTSPARAKSVAELPQVVRIDFDRGRVTVAASITPSYAWGGNQWTGAAENPRKMGLHQAMLMGIVTGMERLLVHRDPPGQAAMAWQHAEAVIADAARRRKRRNLTILLVVFGSLGLLFVVGLILAS